MTNSLLSIGQLAKRVGVRTSTLRYYEAEGLLTPAERTDAGYRLYAPEAEKTLRFIQRAQRLGFSLADIRTLLQPADAATVVELAEERFWTLERQLTELLVLRHELKMVLDEYRDHLAQQDGRPADPLVDRVLDRICSLPDKKSSAQTALEWLIELGVCNLSSADGQELLNTLKGQHVHIWKTDNGYQILVVSHDPQVKNVLERLEQMESECQTHSHVYLSQHPEGNLLTVSGENAFTFARLFLMLEGNGASAS